MAKIQIKSEKFTPLGVFSISALLFDTKLHFLLFLLFYPKINCIFASVFKTYCNLSISDIDVSNNI